MSRRSSIRVVARTVLFLAGLVGVSACPPKPPPTQTAGFAVSGVSPNQGSTLTSTTVRIAGSGFVTGARVTVDGVNTPGSLLNAYSIEITVPAHPSGTVPIVVTNGNGDVAQALTFTYVAPSPVTISGLSPDNVVVTGGQFLINGSGFKAGVSVRIDGIAATTTFLNSSSLQVVAPAHAAGAVDVTVTNPFTAAQVFTSALTYRPLPPMQIDHVEPAVGSTAGGAFLAIYGTSFQNGATVTIDGQKVPAEIGDFEALYIDAPAHAAGPVDIVVTNPDGQTQHLSGGFTYASPDTFNFNGEWPGYVRPAWLLGPTIVIVNGTVTQLKCAGLTGNLIPTPAPVVTNGAFSFTVAGGALFTGHIVAPDEAAGTTNLPGCGQGSWYAYRK